MKILVINTWDIAGGSGIAAYRLCNGIERFHIDAEFFFAVGYKQSNDPRVFCTRKNLKQQLFERLIDRYTNKLGLQYIWFPFSSRAILKLARDLCPDVFYLRNIHGGYFNTALISKLSKMAPIVWTLSDMWSFTGHCAHSFGEMSWREMKSGCPDKRVYPAIGIDTGKWLLRRKKAIYKKSRLKIVTPSKWLYKLARQSPVFKDKEIFQIYNGFDLDVYRPKGQSTCRMALNLPVNAKVLMFSASFFQNNPYKGGADLVEIMKFINEKAREKVHLLIVGRGSLDKLNTIDNLIIHNIGYVQNDVFMSALFSAADAYLYPTRADNLPNVLLEAISCGTPCVTFDIGGCGEIIEDGFNGYVVEPFDTRCFAEKVGEILESQDKREQFSKNARQSAVNSFSLEKMSKNYYDLFRSVIETEKPTGFQVRQDETAG